MENVYVLPAPFPSSRSSHAAPYLTCTLTIFPPPSFSALIFLLACARLFMVLACVIKFIGLDMGMSMSLIKNTDGRTCNRTLTRGHQNYIHFFTMFIVIAE